MSLQTLPHLAAIAVAAALLLAAVAFVALAARTAAPSLALCAGVCGVAAGRVAYGTAREAGWLPR